MPVREAQFQFHWNIQKRTQLVEKYGTNDKKELMQKIAEDIFSDKEPSITPNYETRMKDAKLKYWEAKAREAEAKATIAERTVLHVTTFGTMPSKAAEGAIRIHAENKAKKQNTSILKDDGTLKCISCGKIFLMRAYEFEQANEYQTHVKAIHQRELYIESEKPIIAKLLGIETE